MARIEIIAFIEIVSQYRERQQILKFGAEIEIRPGGKLGL
jgi:hypothetical protein